MDKCAMLDIESCNVSGFCSLIRRAFSDCPRRAIHGRDIHENKVACPSSVQLADMSAIWIGKMKGHQPRRQLSGMTG